ncbi:hypothetical protein Y032_0255g329 [Ancylostoma ceylanicum]|uniref:Uncharacterized protein n=1 Tax=Ancylostoma ceylanicum TaxID=53326 RepID=A0A016SC97_9BILA|nr:hypothetical protein Y032_0255g329 [Ancylostoma ceylanicum]
MVPLYFSGLHRPNSCMAAASHIWPVKFGHRHVYSRYAPVKRKIMEARGVKRHHLEINSRDELVKALVFFTVLNIVQLVCHNVYRILTSHPPPTVMVRLLCR